MHQPDGTINLDAENAATRRSLTTPTDWSLTGYSETPSRNGVAWHGILRKNGVEVGRVSDAGRGGMIDFDWASPEHEAAFHAEEEARYGAQAEPGSAFVNDLATAAQYNKKRSVIFIDDDCNLGWGDCYVLQATVTPAQAKAALTAPGNRYEGKNPMIWDKRQSIFVPAADFDA